MYADEAVFFLPHSWHGVGAGDSGVIRACGGRGGGGCAVMSEEGRRGRVKGRRRGRLMNREGKQTMT